MSRVTDIFYLVILFYPKRDQYFPLIEFQNATNVSIDSQKFDNIWKMGQGRICSLLNILKDPLFIQLFTIQSSVIPRGSNLPPEAF